MKKDFLPKTLNGVSDRRACLNINRGQTATELHYHDCAEMIYVRKGEVRVFFDNGWHTLLCGELFFVPPACIHRCVSSTDGAEQVVIGFTDSLVCESDAARKGIFCPYRSGAISTGYILPASRDLSEQMERLYHMKSEADLSAHISFCARVLETYGMVYGAWEREGLLSASRQPSPIVCEIKDYVAEHFAAKISASELARYLNISYSYLAKLMARELGTSFGNYVVTYRIEMAKKLLLSTKKSVAEISYECGFASSSAFVGRFKAFTGKTPLVFRNEAISSIAFEGHSK